MSKEALYSVIGRSRVDIDFGSRLLENFTQAVKDAGYILTDEEIVYAKQNLPAATASAQGMPPQDFQQQLAMKTANEFTELNITIHKNNFNNASKTYERISRMSSVMFGTGIGLFIFAALYGAFSQQLSYTFVFAGLGAANFIALFILKPMEKSQEALSNLLQAEIAYMNYSNQVTLWGSMYLVPRGFPPQLDPASIKTTSEELQNLTRETMDLLQTYIETPVTKSPEKE
jgi:hypothetical protein